ncbi:ABC transporter permease subunit [Leptospira sp. 2 VSF19]|uniref:ABC transporter permease subunit n=1 Tax=Leptospira soteropolitanensis TaxID=2950025 RepID=A0AAW5VL74_9LEPT|nr:ABC transporter permease subunit [Leptospira soteropolitanensis]MCW7494528.1 ABC transporter permease subunit [Leptospira soteropolitanensis]MCW7502122.1 ABC transporter permease subunit [Leptospira soteropolitanensis]MCW7524448.1 ABC transporter permease subunit [Leptospira soteropolitanensis]MCW7528314.1 ABC transporter permease subunit [Leptospira soteropolitanensis]MCW7532092.1 ABC transporter permease subunit [Leptospira soteropolitanensis]
MTIHSFVRFSFFSLVLIGVFVLSAPTNVDLNNNNLPMLSSGYLAGTDRLGRDNLALFCYGSLSTIILVVPARILTIAVSFVLSAFSLYFPKRSEWILSGVVSVSLAIPSLLSALVVISLLPDNPFAIFIAILVSDWALSYETLTAKIREIKQSSYLSASLCMGAKPYHLILLHYLPALRDMFGFLFFSGLPGVVMTTALFSYLGIQTSIGETGPGLGEQISFSKDYFDKSPVSVLLPIVAILTLVYSLGSNQKKNET